MKSDRRGFITKTAAACASISFVTNSFGMGTIIPQRKKYPIAFFTKPLDDFELGFMAESLAMAGLDGFDLAVRRGGRVSPDRVADDLPKVIETGKQYNLLTDMMVTGITRADNPDTRRVLETAAKQGVKYYRMGYFSYDFKEGIWESLQRIKGSLGDLVQMNKEFGIQGGYQNHSGDRVGAPMWDVWELVRGFPMEYLNSQFDIRHAVTEGAASWILALRLLSKNIGSLAIKDFTWDIANGKESVKSVPLGEGIVDFDSYFKTLKELNIVAPITLHIEYPFLNKEEEEFSLIKKQKIIVSKLKHDVDFIRGRLEKFQLI